MGALAALPGLERLIICGGDFGDDCAHCASAQHVAHPLPDSHVSELGMTALEAATSLHRSTDWEQIDRGGCDGTSSLTAPSDLTPRYCVT
jgi:hypothetical protein